MKEFDEKAEQLNKIKANCHKINMPNHQTLTERSNKINKNK